APAGRRNKTAAIARRFMVHPPVPPGRIHLTLWSCNGLLQSRRQLGKTASMTPSFPATRMRRLRRHEWTRKLVAENSLSASDFIWPLFLVEGEKKREPVASMPGVERLSVDQAVGAAEDAAKLGIPVVALFPHTHPSLKGPDGREALNG